jgi:hypothetical protein
MKWINVKEHLPVHHQVVLAKNEHGFCDVVTFLDSKCLNQLFNSMHCPEEQIDINENPYFFVSRESLSTYFDKVTHWSAIPDKPEEEDTQ